MRPYKLGDIFGDEGWRAQILILNKGSLVTPLIDSRGFWLWSGSPSFYTWTYVV